MSACRQAARFIDTPSSTFDVTDTSTANLLSRVVRACLIGAAFIASPADTWADDRRSGGDAPVERKSKEPVEFERRLSVGARRIQVDLGDIRVDHKLNVRIRLTNETQQPLEMVAMNTSCGCVVGESEKTHAKPGEEFVLDVTIEPHAIVDVFQQKLTIGFKGGVIEPREVVLQARVCGDVEVSPRTLRFEEGGGPQLVKVKGRVDGIRITGMKAMSGAIVVRDSQEISDSEVHLHIEPANVSGQSLEQLRVHYVDINNGNRGSYADLKIGISNYKDYRFIPSNMDLGMMDPEASKRAFLLLNGKYCPADKDSGEVFVRVPEGDDISLPSDNLTLVRRKRRMWEIRLRSAGAAIPGNAEGIIVRFSGKEFLLPFLDQE